MNSWLYLHFPHLQLELALHRLQHDESAELIIVSEKTNEVQQVSAAAQKKGIKQGMGLGAACTLSNKLIVQAVDVGLVTKLQTEIATHLYSKVADISLFGQSGVLLNYAAMRQLYPRFECYWSMLQLHLEALPYTYSAALGMSPFAAKWSAIAKLGVNTHTGKAKKAFLQLPLTLSDLTSKQCTQLARIGAHTYQDVVALLNAELASRVDNQALSYLKQVFAIDVTAVNYFHPDEAFKKHLTLNYEIAELPRLLKPISTLLTQLEHFLLKRTWLAKRIQLTLYYREAEPLLIVLNTVLGQYKQAAWLNLITLKFNHVVLAEPVIEIELALLASEPLHGECADLFNAQQTHVSRSELVSNLIMRLGDNAVLQPISNDDPRPEKSNQLVSWQHATHSQLNPPKGMRPIYLTSAPKPLTQKVSVLLGPERIVSGWWDSEPCTRDYFVVQNQQGQQLWVFRDVNKAWFVHGYFG